MHALAENSYFAHKLSDRVLLDKASSIELYIIELTHVFNFFSDVFVDSLVPDQ